jgi:hypothetical protein
MQSVPITTVVVSLNLDQDGVYNNVQCDKVCQRLATGQLFFSPDPHFSSTNNTEILLKGAINTMKPNQT